MKLVVIKYNAGNIRSVQIALERLGITPVVSDDPETIRAADKLIFPGVGEASSAMEYLRARRLDEVICGVTQPLLGICLGMQLMCSHSAENDTSCLGIFEERVKRFERTDPLTKIPQIGWNNISQLKGPLFNGIDENSYCYFVHSYYASIGEDTIAVTDYCIKYSAALSKRNFFGVQFHPEKSATVGAQIITNFLNIS
jgi:imidazole glycerol-phosphate synthase subunit HisH